MLKNILRQFLFIAIILTAVFTVSHFIYAWSEPVANPPAGNAPAPLNVSNIGQAKVGGLILNTGGAAVGLVVDKGNVGIGELNPGAKLDVAGVTQTDYLVVNQQNGSGEGGEIRLDGSAGNTTWQIDTVGGYIRFHHDGLSSFEVANNGVGRLGQGAAGLLYFGNRGYYIGDDSGGADIQTNAPNMYVYDGGWRRLLREGDITGGKERAWLPMINCGGPAAGCPAGWTDYTGDVKTGWCSGTGDDATHVRSCYKDF